MCDPSNIMFRLFIVQQDTTADEAIQSFSNDGCFVTNISDKSAHILI